MVQVYEVVIFESLSFLLFLLAHRVPNVNSFSMKNVTASVWQTMKK